MLKKTMKLLKIQIHTVPVDDSAATAAPHSSAGTPGWGVIRKAARISVSEWN